MKIGKGNHQQNSKSESMVALGLKGNEHYRAFIDNLVEANVDRHIELPMIAVMGDTSSGKSSILSSISLIELPSSATLTTRCPIMLRMSRNEARSACVSLNWKDMPPGKSDVDIHFKPRQVDESTWQDLTRHIAEAQQHILDKTGKDVARDVVNVKLSGPQCEDLTLIDLPGIVRSTGKGESETLSQDIHVLISDYLKNPRCVILAVHPVNVDFHNSQIMDEAKKVDPYAKRTLPVLTKPDIIDDGAEGSVKELLLGEKTVGFERGFHMVKGRNQAALNRKDSIEQGLQEEEAFFRTRQPWRDVADKSLFGTQELRRKLGDLQMEMVRETFPHIVKEMKEERNKTANEMLVLGPVPSSLSERRLIFSEVRDALVRKARSLLTGASLRKKDEDTCAASFHDYCHDFSNELEEGKLANISDVREGFDVIATIGDTEVRGKVLESDEDVVFLDNYGRTIQENHGREIDVWYFEEDDLEWRIAKPNNTIYIPTPIPVESVCRDQDWIKTMIKKHRQYRLPIFLSADVFEQIVADCLEKEWRQPCLDLIDNTCELLKDTVQGIIEDEAKLSSLPRLRDFLNRHVEDVADAKIRHAREKVEDFIRREKVPYTQNHYLNENLAKLRSQRLKDELIEALSLHDASQDSKSPLSKTIVEKVICGVFERNQKMSVNDHMAEEMQHALDAYGKVAMKRFIDVVPMICGDVLLEFPDEINKVLLQVSDEDLDKVLSVSRDCLNRRTALARKLDELERGLKVLAGFI